VNVTALIRNWSEAIWRGVAAAHHFKRSAVLLDFAKKGSPRAYSTGAMYCVD
jgi:hypothetical protein